MLQMVKVGGFVHYCQLGSGLFKWSCLTATTHYYRVRQSFRESYYLQDSEITIASTETNDTSAESP